MTEIRSKNSRLSVQLLLSAFVFVIAFVPLNASETVYTFQQLLDDAGLSLHEPDGFINKEPEENTVLSYEYALQHQQKRLAVRYAIRPIAMVQIDYEDPHNAAPEPNHLFPMLFQTLVSDFSRGGNSPTNEYSTSDAKSKFNADWAAVGVMDVNRDFSTEYEQLLLLALHKNNASDAYVIILFDDYASVKPEIDSVLGSLMFK